MHFQLTLKFEINNDKLKYLTNRYGIQMLQRRIYENFEYRHILKIIIYRYEQYSNVIQYVAIIV